MVCLCVWPAWSWSWSWTDWTVPLEVRWWRSRPARPAASQKEPAVDAYGGCCPNFNLPFPCWFAFGQGIRLTANTTHINGIRIRQHAHERIAKFVNMYGMQRSNVPIQLFMLCIWGHWVYFRLLTCAYGLTTCSSVFLFGISRRLWRSAALKRPLFCSPPFVECRDVDSIRAYAQRTWSKQSSNRSLPSSFLQLQGALDGFVSFLVAW